MAYTVNIDGDRLISLLEDDFGNVFENIKEEDRITKVQLHGNGEVEIVIGDEE